MVERKILVVDDDPTQRALLSDILEVLGYKIETIGEPVKALEVLKDEFYPLIITDLMMPEMDGAQLCKKIREINSESVIYALSGHVAEFDPDRLEDVGFDGHLFKPVDINKLKRAIAGAFDKIDNR